jgi:hypothetical protein
LIVNVFKGTDTLREFLFIGSMVTGILVQYLTYRDNMGGHKRSQRT